jgi:hypothetical protein
MPLIIAVVEVDNQTSQRVAKRIGMARVETIEAHGRPTLTVSVSRALTHPMTCTGVAFVSSLPLEPLRIRRARTRALAAPRPVG